MCVSRCSFVVLRRLLPSVLLPRSPSTPWFHKTYLILNNALLEPWPAHRNFPRILTPRPDTLVVRRLCNPHLLGLFWRLLQDLVESALGRGRDRIGLGDVWLRIALDGVIGGDLVAGGRGRGVADEGAGGGRCATGAQGTKSGWKHIRRGVGADGLRNCLEKITVWMMKLSFRGFALDTYISDWCYWPNLSVLPSLSTLNEHIP